MNIKDFERYNKNKKNKNNVGLFFVFYILIVFIVLFTYSSLNLKNIDYGYKLQKLILKEKVLNEEIDKLKSIKANLLSLDRVESIVTKKLGYQYPKPEQFIKVFEE